MIVVLVTWYYSNDDLPEGTVGKIIEIQDDGKRVVKFIRAQTTTFNPYNLVLATEEQAAQWDIEEHMSMMAVGGVVKPILLNFTAAIQKKSGFTDETIGVIGEIMPDGWISIIKVVPSMINNVHLN